MRQGQQKLPSKLLEGIAKSCKGQLTWATYWPLQLLVGQYVGSQLSTVRMHSSADDHAVARTECTLESQQGTRCADFGISTCVSGRSYLNTLEGATMQVQLSQHPQQADTCHLQNALL